MTRQEANAIRESLGKEPLSYDQAEEVVGEILHVIKEESFTDSSDSSDLSDCATESGGERIIPPPHKQLDRLGKYRRDEDTGRGSWDEGDSAESEVAARLAWLQRAYSQVTVDRAYARRALAEATAQLTEARLAISVLHTAIEVIREESELFQFLLSTVDNYTRFDDGSAEVRYTVGCLTSVAEGETPKAALDAARRKCEAR